MSKLKKVKLNLKNIEPIDEEEREVLEAWDGIQMSMPEEVLDQVPEYSGEKQVAIFEEQLDPSQQAFLGKELVSISSFAKNPSKYLAMLEKGDLKKLAILKNNKIKAIVYPVKGN